MKILLVYPYFIDERIHAEDVLAEDDQPKDEPDDDGEQGRLGFGEGHGRLDPLLVAHAEGEAGGERGG